MSEIIRIYIDMDGVLCNFEKHYQNKLLLKPDNKFPQSEYGFFTALEEMPNAIKSINSIAKYYDAWILTRPSIENPLCYTEKRIWVEQHLGMKWIEKLIITPNKGLMIGDFLVDDDPWPNFIGKQILFGSEEFPDWEAVLKFLKISK